MIDVPAFAAQQDVQAAVAVAHPGRGKVTYAHPEGRLIPGRAAVTER